MRAVSGGAVRWDAFEYLLALSGLDATRASMPRGNVLSPQEASRLLADLSRQPVTTRAFPPRLALGHLLREILESGEVTREELLRRVERFKHVAVLRPDGRLAWALDGRTQQKVGPVEWKEDAFLAGPFKLGHFYVSNGSVFRQADVHLRPIEGPPLAEVHDDADLINQTMDGTQEAFIELVHALGQWVVHPVDSLESLRHLPAGVSALIATSPEYRERFRNMTRGEQTRAFARLTTNLLATFGTAGGTTRTLTRAVSGWEATVPILSLSPEGLLLVERVAVPVGRVATVLSGGPGAALILHRANEAGQASAPPAGPGQWAPAEESMSARARAYQEQISGHSAHEAYWVGGVGRKSKGVRFDGFKDGVLLEAKGPGYANKFLENLEPKNWFKSSGAKALVDQAIRQLNAARSTKTPIRWHIAEEKSAEAIRFLFRREQVFGIEIIHTPAI
ncbi:hypothetical protein I3V78_38545 [Archangium primigenium]|nr:hypothetical protein [Archangium primigenium]